MINVSAAIRSRVISSYGKYFERLSHVPAEKIAHDVLDEEKVHDQVALFCRTTGIAAEDLRGKRLLEVGCGFGVFLTVLRRDYGVESFGIEPASGGFDSSFQLGRDIVAAYGFDLEIISNAVGEDLPFPDESFDYIFSSTVLEHTQDPALVLQESLRVLKTGGYLQFVYPNYGGFFDGHYVVPWIPYISKGLGRWWVRLWGRDPDFVETLQLTNWFRTRRWLKELPRLEVLTLGEDVFRERMLGLDIKTWAGLGRVQGWLHALQKLKLVPLASWTLLGLKSYDPIILTGRKRGLSPSEQPDNRAIYEESWQDWTDMKRHGPSSRWLRSLIGDALKETSRVRNVLDVGCGEGSTTAFLARTLPRADVLGVDRSSAGIKCAKEAFGSGQRLRFAVEESLTKLPSESADLVSCFEVLEHVEDWHQLTMELARLTRKYVLVSFPTGRMRQFEVNIGHLRNFRFGQFERHAATAGLKPIRLSYAGFPFYSPIFRNVCNWTNSGGTSLTRGHYGWTQKRLADLIYLSFRHFSSRRRHGDQFCGLFEKVHPHSP